MSYLSRLRNLPERMRARYFPRLAEFLLTRSTSEARGVLSRSEPVSILVDNTVLGLAITHETRWINFKTFGAAVRVPVYGIKNTSEQHQHASYLTGLIHLAKLGYLKHWVSAELLDEQFRQPIGRYRGYGLFDHSLYAGVKLESVDGHVLPTMGPKWMKMPTAQQQQRARLAQSDNAVFSGLYKLLSEQLGPKCDQDAWHVATAEKHGLFCFLTTDKPLLLAAKGLSKKEPLRSLNTRIMSPIELGQHLGIHRVPPLLLSYGGKDAMVRTDYTMPHERRRKRNEYRKP